MVSDNNSCSAPSASTNPSEPVRIYVAASCDATTGLGGWGLYAPRTSGPLRDSGTDVNTTANALGLAAICQTLDRSNSARDLEFICNNAYITNSFIKDLADWIESGWQTADRRPVANQGYWKHLSQARCERQFAVRRPTADEADQIEEARRLAARALSQARRAAA